MASNKSLNRLKVILAEKLKDLVRYEELDKKEEQDV